MKWAIRGLGALLSIALLLAAGALILPFVVDFNQFKPQIKTAVGDAVNADLEFSSARLTILTGLGVKLKNVKITHTDETFKGIDFIKVEDLTFRIDLQPLLHKRLEGYVAIDKPEITIATKDQRNSLASLQKVPTAAEEAAEVGEPAPAAKPETPEQKANREAMIEQFKRNVVMRSFEITQARFTLLDYAGEKAEERLKIEDLNISISNIGLEEDITTVISTKLALDEPGFRVAGPLSTKIIAQINTNGSALRQASLRGKVDLDQLAINVQDAFVKAPGIPLNLEFSGNAGLNNVNLTGLDFNLHTIKVTGSARVDDFQKLTTDLSFGVESNDLKALGDVLPQHKDMLIGGRLKLNAEARGMLSELQSVKAKLALDTQLTGADLALNLDVTNAKAPVLAMNMRSNELDLNKLLGPFMPEDSEPEPTPDPNAPPAQDFALSAEQKELLKDAEMRFDIRLKKVIYDEINIDNLMILSEVKDLQASVEMFGLDVFDGRIDAKGKANLAANPIAFEGAFNLKAVQVQNSVALLAPQHEDLITGKASFDLNLAGSGTTVETLSKTLDALGTFAFLNGTANVGSIAEQLADKLNGFIADSSIIKSSDRVFTQAEEILSNPLVQTSPQAREFNLTQKKQQYSAFSQINVSDQLKADKNLRDTKGTLEIKDGRLFIASMKASDSGGMDFASSVGMDLSLAGGATFTASEAFKNYMKAQSLYAPLLFDEQGNFALDMSLGGTAIKPSVKVNFDPLRKRFSANAKALVEKEVKMEAEKLKDSLVKDKLDTAEKELAQKRAEAEKRLAEEKAKAEAEKKKAEAEAKAKAEAEAEALKKKAEEKLKEKFGF